MTPPTDQEIEQAHDRMTADGPDSPLTKALADATVTNPLLCDALERAVRNGMALHLVQPGLAGEAWLTGNLAGMLIYGLYLGIYIGETRAGDA